MIFLLKKYLTAFITISTKLKSPEVRLFEVIFHKFSSYLNNLDTLLS